MSNNELEALLWGYVRWVRSGDEWRKLGYPVSGFAKLIPHSVDLDGIPRITDVEGEQIGKAMMALKSMPRFGDAYKVIEARFFYGVVDDKEIGRRWKIGSKNKVWIEKQRAYTFLIAKIMP